MDTLRFYFVTWNVATKSPSQDLNSLLDFPSQFNKNKPLPDFYVIGLQEVKSQPQNLIMDTLFTDPWTSAFSKILCRSGYIIAKSKRLQGIMIMVYAQVKHLVHLRDIEAQYTKTGLGGMWGNKGAVGVRFNIYGCSVCLVNCHMTAHEHLNADRIEDYNTIIKQQVYHVAETTNILYHDYVFWFGDLNFRNDYPHSEQTPSAEEMVAQIAKVEKDKYEPLLQYDQLRGVQRSEEAFSEFTEPDIRFPPTYKFNIGTDDYDLKRKPSWTDRILYKVIANNYENITLRADSVMYNHISHYTLSDHKPVVAMFTIKIVPSKITRRSKTRLPGAEVLAPMSAAYNADATDGGVQPFSPISHSTVRLRSAVLSPAPMAAHTSTLVEPAPIDEAFSNYTEKTVEFAPISQIWYIGDADFRIQCTLSPDVECHPSDWIGIYDADFHNLEDYISYEYLSKVSVPSSAAAGQPRVITLSFPVGCGVRTPGFYRFIYFSQPNSDVRSVLGISDPFEVSSKDDILSTQNLHNLPSSSTSAPRTKPTTAHTDIFTDFTGLDVANLSRHFSNDLSID